MSGFSDQPIGRKALVLGLAPTMAAIVLVVAASMLATYFQARGNEAQDLGTEAAIVAENVGAALAFNDKQAASDTVKAFRAKNNITAVCVFDASGALFTSFTQDGGACPDNRDAKSPSTLVYERPVTVGAREVGSIRLTGNLTRLYDWMGRQVSVAGASLIAAFLLSLILTRWLGRAITDPVLGLARTAERVSNSGDYSVRATQTTNDELGRLTQSFNGMLDQIQKQHESLSELLEREQESSRLKDQFLAAVSHELRTPLNAILGWVQIVRTTNPGPETVARALESLERNAHMQARLIEDLIETSRAVTGKLQLKTEVVDLRAVVTGALDVVNPAVNAKGIRVTVSQPPAASLVSGDPDRLQQTVWNLLANAVKFTPPGGWVTVDLSARGSDFVLVVQDSGVGIPQDFLPFVFDRFRQADGSMTREHGGLGLGLAIVRDIVELHGGAVTAASGGRGEGATFTIRLPQLIETDSAGERGDARPLRQPIPDGALAGTRVLAVDDDRDALEIVKQSLTAAGASVMTASSGADAIAIGRRERFDVLVCDLAMPRIDGFDVLKALRESSPSFANGAYAIALTAHASPEDRARALAAGFQAHLSKPYALDALISAIAGRKRSSAGL